MERWRLSGAELHSGEKLTIMYTGVLVNKNYFASLIFGDNYTEEYLGRRRLWKLASRTDKGVPAAQWLSLKIEMFGKSLLKKGYIKYPAGHGKGFSAGQVPKLFEKKQYQIGYKPHKTKRTGLRGEPGNISFQPVLL